MELISRHGSDLCVGILVLQQNDIMSTIVHKDKEKRIHPQMYVVIWVIFSFLHILLTLGILGSLEMILQYN